SMPNAIPAGAADVPRGVRRIASRCTFNGDRRASSTPAGSGCGRGHPPHSHSGAHHFAGTDRRVFEESSTRHRRPRSYGTRAVKSRSIFASTRKAVRVPNFALELGMEACGERIHRTAVPVVGGVRDELVVEADARVG